ncbi:MAG: hypothetical protein V4619_01875 [Bacteroidota bacterium]
MSQITPAQRTTISAAYTNITAHKGEIFRDGGPAYSADTVVNAFINIETKFDYTKALACISAFLRFSTQATNGQVVTVHINTEDGTVSPNGL